MITDTPKEKMGLTYTPEQADELLALRDGYIEQLRIDRADLLDAINRLMPWIGKMIADGSHLSAVCPRDCTAAFQQAFDTIKRIQSMKEKCAS